MKAMNGEQDFHAHVVTLCRVRPKRRWLFYCAALIVLAGLPVLPHADVRAEELPGWTNAGRSDVTQDSLTRHPPRLMLLPIIFSSPDTRVALGVLPQVVFRFAPDSHPSSIRLDAYYTMNRQFHVLLQPTIWLRENAHAVSGRLSAKRWPTSFYGIGNDTPSDNAEKYTEDLVEVSLEGLRRVHPGVYASIRYALRYGHIRDVEAHGRLAAGGVPGTGRSRISGLGVGLKFDTRDAIFYPSRGSLYQVEVMTAQRLMGSDYPFMTLSLDLRRYFPVYRHHVLAVQGIARVTIGSPPFRALPGIGEALRGYSTVRHVDRHLVGVQAEYRIVPVYWRLGLTVFGGVGEVFERVEDIRFDELKYVVGLGLRYQFSRTEKINIRMDYGFGRDSSGDYIDLTEAY